LPTSDAQDRIAEFLLTKEYPAVVCEGPPGTVRVTSKIVPLPSFLQY
jgi:hypothetical protein